MRALGVVITDIKDPLPFIPLEYRIYPAGFIGNRVRQWLLWGKGGKLQHVHKCHHANAALSILHPIA